MRVIGRAIGGCGASSGQAASKSPETNRLFGSVLLSEGIPQNPQSHPSDQLQCLPLLTSEILQSGDTDVPAYLEGDGRGSARWSEELVTSQSQSPSERADYDASLLGTPAHFGSISAQMSDFRDQSKRGYHGEDHR